MVRESFLFKVNWRQVCRRTGSYSSGFQAILMKFDILAQIQIPYLDLAIHSIVLFLMVTRILSPDLTNMFMCYICNEVCSIRKYLKVNENIYLMIFIIYSTALWRPQSLFRHNHEVNTMNFQNYFHPFFVRFGFCTWRGLETRNKQFSVIPKPSTVVLLSYQEICSHSSNTLALPSAWKTLYIYPLWLRDPLQKHTPPSWDQPFRTNFQSQ